MVSARIWSLATQTMVWLLPLLAGGCSAGTVSEKERGVLKLRHLTDASGPTQDVSVPLTNGIEDYFEYHNRQGGIRGYKIELVVEDYAYKADQAEAIYNRWKNEPSWSEVVTIFGLGTPDSTRLSPYVTQDRIPYLSQSYLGSLAAPKPIDTTYVLPDGTSLPVKNVGAPFNFFAGTDYSTSIRIAMNFIRKRGGYRVAFLHCSANAYCTAPIVAAKSYLAELGMMAMGEPATGRFPELSDSAEVIDTKIKEYFAQNKDVEWAWIGNLTATTVSIAKAVAKYAPQVRMVANTWGFDETVYQKCGDPCVNRLFGLVPFAAYGDTRFPEMENVVMIHDLFRNEKGEPPTQFANLRYVQGYVAALLFGVAIERLVDQERPVTRENLRELLETFKGLQTGGLSGPITFTPDDHRPTAATRIYSINSFGKLKYEDEIKITLRPEWLGW